MAHKYFLFLAKNKKTKTTHVKKSACYSLTEGMYLCCSSNSSGLATYAEAIKMFILS